MVTNENKDHQSGSQPDEIRELTNRDIRLTGALSGINPFLANNSASRAMMDVSHIAQAVVLDNPDRMDISSGMDYEYANYVYDIRLEGEEDQDVKILKIIKKYARTGGDRTIPINPTTLVIYENLTTHVIDVAEVPSYYCYHVTFGFNYVYTDIFKNLRVGDVYPCGTVLATSPQVDQVNNTYCLGQEVLVAMGSFKEVIDDGVGVSESFAKRMSTNIYSDSVVNYGETHYPLNLYGDENNYKPFPDIGDKIRDDGLVFALRELDPMLAPVQMTPKALMEVDYHFDLLTYGEPRATVVDVTVQHSHNPAKRHVPTNMSDQPMRYWEAHTRHFRELEQYYRELRRIKSDSLKLSPALHHMITVGMQQDHARLKRSNKLTYRKEDIQDFRVVVTYTKKIPLDIGSKLSCLNAAKSVVCRIIPDEQMPLDRFGRRAEVITDSGSSMSRMNVGRLFYSELTESLRQQRLQVQSIWDNEGYQSAFDYLMKYYSHVSPEYHQLLLEGLSTKEDKELHLKEFINNETSLFLPHGSKNVGSEMSKELNELYPVDYSKVILYDTEGNGVESKDDFLIARLYMIRLEKIGNFWASTSIPKRQHHGIISKLSSNNKNALPYRDQAIRIAGETEVRVLMAAGSSAFVSSLLSLANNAAMCNDAVRTLLKAENPVRVKEVVDYSKLGEYPSRSLDRIKHLLYCAGQEFYYDDERPHSLEEFSDLEIDDDAFDQVVITNEIEDNSDSDD